MTPVASVGMDREAPSRSRPSDYREFPVPEPLARHFLCLWTQSISSHGEYAHRVLPDACADVLCLNEEPPVVVGPWTAPFIARLPAGTWIVGARLHPGRASSWLGVPAAELLNRTVPLRLLRGSRTSSLFARIAEQADLTSRRSALAAALLGCLAFTRPIDRAVSAGIAWIAHHPHGRVEQLSRWIGVSDRQLRRRFASSVGYGPKTLQSVLRFQRLLSFAASGRTTESLAALAVDAGYADQAHMTREVRRFADHAPSALLGSTPCTLEMSDLFKIPDGARDHSLERDAQRAHDSGDGCSLSRRRERR